MALPNDAGASQLALSHAHVELDARIHWQGIAQLCVATGGADIAEQSLDRRGSAFRSYLDRSGAGDAPVNSSCPGLHRRQLAYLHSHVSLRNDIVRKRHHPAHPGNRMRINRPFSFRQFYAPDVLARLDAVHADLPRFGTARIAHPDHAKAGFLLPVLDADDIALLADVFDPGDTGACAGYIDGARLAGEWASHAVHPPDADGEFCRLPVIYAASHVVVKNDG
jgi:hypothetical protein